MKAGNSIVRLLPKKKVTSKKQSLSTHPTTMSSLVAVNVCVIPPKHIVDIAVKASTAMCQQLKGTDLYYTLQPIDVESDIGRTFGQSQQQKFAPSNIKTPEANVNHGFPHFTLFQLCTERQNAKELADTIRGIVAEVTNPETKIDTTLTLKSSLSEGPVFEKTPKGEDVRLPSLDFNNTGVVKALHEAIAKGIKKYNKAEDISNDTLKGAFSSKWPGNDGSAKWVKNFEKNSSFDKYAPHLTLGSCLGKPDDDALKLSTYTNGGDSTLSFHLADCAIVVAEMANNCCCFNIIDAV